MKKNEMQGNEMYENGREMKEIPMELRPKVRYWLPGAAMNEEDLRTEIRALAKRGFGGIEAVVLQNVPPDVLLSEDSWGTANWDRMVDVMNDETKRLGMSLDLAAGPGWPIASPVLSCADDPGTLCELTYGCLALKGGSRYEGPLPKRRIVREEGTPVRIAVMAYRCDTSDPEKNARVGTVEKTAFGEREYRLPLIVDSYVDLNDRVFGEEIAWDVPGTEEDQWMLFAFWRQPAVQKINGGNTYVVDHLSGEGSKAVADYWEPIFDSHTYDAMESLFCDSLEYDVAADWTPKLLEFFMKNRGYDLLPYLPFIGMTNTFPAGDVPAFSSVPERFREQVNNDYMEILTQMYCQKHLEPLEKMAEKYGKTVRYQVAYNKPLEEERCGLCVGIPENEALGRSQLDGQRLMAAAAHFGRKERYSFECAAEFGQCYGQGYEDLMWWVKRSLMAGMNAQVLHGASYSGSCAGSNPQNSLMKTAAWPGYEGFGKFITNNWNRTPDVDHARGCMDAIARLNGVFRKHARVDVCIFRQAYENNGNGPDFYLYGDDGALMNAGYSYEYVSDYLLHLPQAVVREKELDREGAGYRALIVPPQERMSGSAMEKIRSLAEEGLAVVLVGEAPKEALYYSECRTEEAAAAWEAAKEALWEAAAEAGGHAAGALEKRVTILHAADLSEVPKALEQLGVRPRATLKTDGDVMTAVRCDAENGLTWYALYGYNRVHTGTGTVGPGDADPSCVKPVYQRPGKASERTVEVTLENRGQVRVFDPWSGKMTPADFRDDGEGRLIGTIRMEEDEMVVLCVERRAESGAVKKNISEKKRIGTVTFETFSFYQFGPDTPEETSFLRSGFSEKPVWTKKLSKEEALIPWRQMDPALEFAAGAGIYQGTLFLERPLEEGERLILCLGDVYDTFTVRLNGSAATFPDQVMKRVDVTEFAREGKNSLEVRVVSELHNQLIGRAEDSGLPGVPKIPYVPRDYGIVPSEKKPIEVYAIR